MKKGHKRHTKENVGSEKCIPRQTKSLNQNSRTSMNSNLLQQVERGSLRHLRNRDMNLPLILPKKKVEKVALEFEQKSKKSINKFFRLQFYSIKIPSINLEIY